MLAGQLGWWWYYSGSLYGRQAMGVTRSETMEPTSLVANGYHYICCRAQIPASFALGDTLKVNPQREGLTGKRSTDGSWTSLTSTLNSLTSILNSLTSILNSLTSILNDNHPDLFVCITIASPQNYSHNIRGSVTFLAHKLDCNSPPPQLKLL